MSEWTLITEFWSNLFEALFVNADLKFVWYVLTIIRYKKYKHTVNIYNLNN